MPGTEGAINIVWGMTRMQDYKQVYHCWATIPRETYALSLLKVLWYKWYQKHIWPKMPYKLLYVIEHCVTICWKT